ncbi:hypothetical protein THF1D04_270005 [Vibrio owensii]|uniref:Uncharacterized protein n=1 Tax=Vibrio owensii TaxID=696485 RepID=A0AAU9Q6K3_9VIBR|nr:hypothetical protein THF1D04_270005 [Vibrio owensii]
MIIKGAANAKDECGHTGQVTGVFFDSTWCLNDADRCHSN